ncbi:Serine/threonine-protein phosphatase 7 long form [Glycine max]|nr:Serine/threonine-protein phosphatase 7 long form [Glycine max]
MPKTSCNLVLKNLNNLHPRVKQLIDQAGFGHILKIQPVEINHHLIIALLERWRTKTLTFHFPYREITMTLEDVVVQLGLPIDGEVITSISSGDLVAWCEPLLGYLPPTGCASGNMIKLSWLNNEFQQLPNDVDKVAFAQHTQAHILSLIGGLLMQNTISSWVHLMVLLLQSWVCDRITCISPRIEEYTNDEAHIGLGFPLARMYVVSSHEKTTTPTYAMHIIRYMFDRLRTKEVQFLWTPYSKVELSCLINVKVSPITCAFVPLICFTIVELHQANRVMRQFGFRQHIPLDPLNTDILHKEDMRGRINRYWPQYISPRMDCYME